MHHTAHFLQMISAIIACGVSLTLPPKRTRLPVALYRCINLYLGCVLVCGVYGYAYVWINRVWLPILLVVSYAGKFICFSTHSRQTTWPRETGSTVPSRVHLLILNIQAEFWAYSPVLPLSATASIHTLNRHRVSPEFIRPRKCVNRWRSPPRVHRRRTSTSEGSLRTGAAFPGITTMDPFLCASLFPRPLLVQ